MGIAREGAMVKSMGFVAASAQERIRARGFVGRDCEWERVVRMSAEAPSLIALAFAAVTVPSFLHKSERLVEGGGDRGGT
jgi:hypothetical protein